MKTRVTQNSLGPYKYRAIYVRGLGHQIQWINPPPDGTKVMHMKKISVVNGIGAAGMVHHTDKSGFEHASFPSDLRLVRAK